MKRTPGIIILSLLFLAGSLPVLFPLALQVQQSNIHSLMEDRLEKSQLQTLTLKTSDIHWIEKDKELTIDGKLFDVKSTLYSEGVCTLQGLFDEKETALFAQLIESESGPDSMLLKKMSQFFQWLQDMFRPVEKENSGTLSINDNNKFALASPLANHFKTIITPPPQSVIC